MNQEIDIQTSKGNATAGSTTASSGGEGQAAPVKSKQVRAKRQVPAKAVLSETVAKPKAAAKPPAKSSNKTEKPLTEGKKAPVKAVKTHARLQRPVGQAGAGGWPRAARRASPANPALGAV